MMIILQLVVNYSVEKGDDILLENHTLSMKVMKIVEVDIARIHSVLVAMIGIIIIIVTEKIRIA